VAGALDLLTVPSRLEDPARDILALGWDEVVVVVLKPEGGVGAKVRDKGEALQGSEHDPGVLEATIEERKLALHDC
jgi:hypothetical protein